jgi:phosphate-selective porin
MKDGRSTLSDDSPAILPQHKPLFLLDGIVAGKNGRSPLPTAARTAKLENNNGRFKKWSSCMFTGVGKKLRLLKAGMYLACLLAPPVLAAAEPGAAALKARLEALEKDNQELRDLLGKPQASPVSATAGAPGAPLDPHTVEKIVGDMLNKKQEEKKQQEAAARAAADAEAAARKAEGYEVGSILNMNGAWTPTGVLFSTPNKDFQFHMGGRLEYDNVWWREPFSLTGPAPGTSGLTTFTPFPANGKTGAFATATPGISSAALGARQLANTTQPPPNIISQTAGPTGVGQLEDGSFFRRARFETDGVAYGVMEWNVEFDFQTPNTVLFDNTYFGVRDLPLIGTLRAGNMKVPQGLESYGATKFMPTLERSTLFDAFENQFGMGFYASNTLFDQRMTWHYMFSRLPNAIAQVPVDFGDGDYAHTVRVTGLPIYLDDGRSLLHLGLSYQYKVNPKDTGDGNGEPGVNQPGTPLSPGSLTSPGGAPLFSQSVRVTRFRDRAGLRDATGTGSGAAGVSLGDSGRYIDTGDIIAPRVNTLGGELMAYTGPFWLQCEGVWANTPDAIYPPGTAVVPSTNAVKVAAVPNTYDRGTLNYWGYYLMAGYFLTGENRGYSRRFATYDRVRPNENFFLVRGDDGKPQFGWGAWELLYRWSYTDLDSKGCDGGRLGEHLVGLNWHLNPNCKIQVNYIIDQRNFNALVPAFNNTNSLIYSNVATGQTQGLGLRFHLDF